MFRLKEEDLRFKRIPVCKECGDCKENRCSPSKQKLDDSYNGIRFTADGYDCALPVSIDAHGSCSYACMYCFAEFLGGHKDKHNIKVKQYNIDKLDKIFSGENQTTFAKSIRSALKYDQNGKKCPVQLGALTDPFDNIERSQGWMFNFIKLLKKHNQPCRISTKGTLFLQKEYLDLVSEPELLWVAFSIISPDDNLLSKIDLYAPTATDRIKSMKELSRRGVKTSLRFRPIIPGVSDSTPKHPKAYKDLIEMSADAGAKAVSMECLFAPGVLYGDAKNRWDKLQSIINFDLINFYKRITPKAGACIRPSRAWVEDIFLACREITHKNGMVFAVSDPVMKHLNDTGNCCGMLPDDPIFGNWSRENANQAIQDAKQGKIINGKDYIPKWAYDIMLRDMCMQVGAAGAIASRTSWASKLLNVWNDLKSNRGALIYFQGILEPVGLDVDKNILFRYREPKHSGNKNQVFKI